MTVKTVAGTANADRDGCGDPAYQIELKQVAFEGQRSCILVVLALGLVGFFLSSILHWIVFKVIGEWAQTINFWITFPTFGLVFWGMGLISLLSKGQLWLKVPENYSQILIDVWPGRQNRMIKVPGGLWFIAPWWLVIPRNLTNHEDQTVILPSHEYPAYGGEGGAVVEGSFTWYTPFGKARGFISQDRSVIERRLVDHIKGEIGPVIARHSVKNLAGQSTMVTQDVTATFLGALDNETEKDCHVLIREVTISQVALDEKTKAELEKNQAATAQANRMKSLLAVIEENGATIDDPVKRFDRIKLTGLDPGRTITDNKEIKRYEADENMIKVAEAFGVGIAQTVAMLAKITGDLTDLKGGKPKEGGK